MSLPNTVLSPIFNDPSWARIALPSPMCTHLPISRRARPGVAWISTPLPRKTMPLVITCGFSSLNFANRAYRTKYQGV
ncbi:hypothetical protein HMPREF9336_04266 [Segniliparus rugosus ATCC BAA-974]|uniref:Uncharacterized protein n=1 Tax=Segniliparus rugosus (strain ATCC BAA-974 / DSM 45345 / CCUG 50838 / CIP 108380 / JCM 13579 / CDC 945) TaxID=679197 RepID=U1M142_SEGRC|nr:hypothetical protein HMPREF9336_04266 [Segniliparus rugosus ATCC BAA-974]